MQILETKFITDNKTVNYQTEKDQFEVGDLVIVDTDKICELARVTNKHKSTISEETLFSKSEGKIVRVVNESDRQKIEKLKETAREFIPICISKTKKYKLEAMKILDADLSFDAKKLTIYFSSNIRIDFRALVSDLVRSFKKLIRLQQIGVREQTKRFCGFGKCGRQTCCSLYLTNLDEINFDLAKEQGLIDSGTGRITGCCGKPTCCLKYEAKTYQEILAKMPKIGLKLKTRQGVGEIVERNIIKNTVTVKLPDKTKIEIPV